MKKNLINLSKPPKLKKKYKVLLKSDSLEIRKYPPQKRTVSVAGKSYFLQFPYIVFAKKHHKKGNYSLHVALAKESDDYVYFLPFAHVEGSTFAVCLGYVKRERGSFRFKVDYDFDELVEMFWTSSYQYPYNTYFAKAYDALLVNYGRYHAWQEMSLLEVLSQTQSGKVSFDDFVEAVSLDLTDNQVLDRFHLERSEKIMPAGMQSEAGYR